MPQDVKGVGSLFGGTKLGDKGGVISTQVSTMNNKGMGRIKESSRKVMSINKQRRGSSVFDVAKEAMNWDEDAMSRLSFSCEPSEMDIFENKKKEIKKLQPTYNMQVARRPYMTGIKHIAHEILEQVLSGEEYEMWRSRTLCENLSEEIKQRIRSSDFLPDRYKLVVLVYVGQINDQDIRIATRGLMLPGVDNWCDANFKDKSIFGTAIIYCLNQD